MDALPQRDELPVDVRRRREHADFDYVFAEFLTAAWGLRDTSGSVAGAFGDPFGAD